MIINEEWQAKRVWKIKREEEIVGGILMGKICFQCPCRRGWHHYPINLFTQQIFIDYLL